MNPMAIGGRPPASGESARLALGEAGPASWIDRMRGVRQVCRQMFGIPDYERYLAHAAARHPGAPILSRRDFCARAIERKYGKSGPRCC
jgi:uncharacterized short protein YbdD (DUF466 family)